MLNLTKKEYLKCLAKPLEINGFHPKLKENHYYKDSYIALTMSCGKDYFHVKIKRKWFYYLGKYEIFILCSNIEVLEKIEKANIVAKTNTGFFNSEKRKFHNKIQNAILNLRTEYNNYLNSGKGLESLNEKIEKWKTDIEFKEKLKIYDFVNPAIGLETDEKGCHLVFGIAVGGDRLGGLILFDPFEGQIEVGAYLGFGNYGIYDSLEFDFINIVSDIDLPDDY
jgi:hypothetical protein